MTASWEKNCYLCPVYQLARQYVIASEEHPELKRNSFIARVIACTPDHSSYKHHTSKRDYFSYIGPGLYRLNDKYKEKQGLFQNINVKERTG